MASLLSGEPSYHGMVETSPYLNSNDRRDDGGRFGSSWYYSRKEIEENSPSRIDGIDLKKETYLRKAYCTILQDLGMRLKVPQVTIATAIVFCHRFFLRQSHAKNDRRTVATVCMFLAGKVEETPRPLKDVILISYEVIHKKDPAAVQRIKQKEVYEQQKELILLGERVVLATLGFDLNVHHPYKPLVDAIKKFKVAQNALAQVAWNFVNDGLRTSLCLQFKPHHIAAGAIFLAAKFLKVKLPSDGEKVWWQEFDVTPRQLEEVSNQMLELYEQNRAAPQSHGNETEGSSAGAGHRDSLVRTQGSIDETPPQNGYSQATRTPSVDQSASAVVPAPSGHEQLSSDRHGSARSNREKDQQIEDEKVSSLGAKESRERNSGANDDANVCSPMVDAMNRIDKDKVKAALEKRRRTKGAEVLKRMDLANDDDLIERELESGIELSMEDDKMKQDRKQSWSKRTDERAPYNAEEGELSTESQGFLSPESSRRRKRTSPDRPTVGKDNSVHQGFHHVPPKHTDHHLDDARGAGKFSRADRDHKRFRQDESHP